ncbi:hypothetical protein K439DRAFT_592186 [Ramaria rubella]|nr:hypothetical protein K439DRAFT_592186 [Ramaria rubella]
MFCNIDRSKWLILVLSNSVNSSNPVTTSSPSEIITTVTKTTLINVPSTFLESIIYTTNITIQQPTPLTRPSMVTSTPQKTPTFITKLAPAAASHSKFQKDDIAAIILPVLFSISILAFGINWLARRRRHHNERETGIMTPNSFGALGENPNLSPQPGGIHQSSNLARSVVSAHQTFFKTTTDSTSYE